MADERARLESLSALFGRWRVDVEAVPEGYGLSTDRRGGAGPRMIPALLRGRAVVLRSRSVDRLLRRLDDALGRLARPPASNLVPMRQLGALVRGGTAALVPVDLIDRSSALERAVSSAGATIAEWTSVWLDLDTLEVVVEGGILDPATRHALADPVATQPGRYRIGSITWDERWVTSDERPATALARLLQLMNVPAGYDRQHLIDRRSVRRGDGAVDDRTRGRHRSRADPRDPAVSPVSRPASAWTMSCTDDGATVAELDPIGELHAEVEHVAAGPGRDERASQHRRPLGLARRWSQRIVEVDEPLDRPTGFVPTVPVDERAQRREQLGAVAVQRALRIDDRGDVQHRRDDEPALANDGAHRERVPPWPSSHEALDHRGQIR